MRYTARFASLVAFVLLVAFQSPVPAAPLDTSQVTGSTSVLGAMSWLPDPDHAIPIGEASSRGRYLDFVPLEGTFPIKATGGGWLRLDMVRNANLGDGSGGQAAGMTGAFGNTPLEPLFLHLGDLPAGMTEVYLAGDSELPWATEVRSFEVLQLPEPGLAPVQHYLHMEATPNPWFNPMLVRGNESKPLLPPDLLLPGLLLAAAAVCLLRSLKDRALWPFWATTLLGCALVQSLLPLPLSFQHVTYAHLPAMLAPGLCLILFSHLARLMLHTHWVAPGQDLFLRLFPLIGVAVCLGPLLPGFFWLTRLFPLWGLALVLLLPVAAGALASKRAGAFPFFGAVIMPFLGSCLSAATILVGYTTPVSYTASLWGMAVGGIALALASVGKAPAAVKRKKEGETLPEPGKLRGMPGLSSLSKSAGTTAASLDAPKLDTPKLDALGPDAPKFDALKLETSQRDAPGQKEFGHSGFKFADSEPAPFSSGQPDIFGGGQPRENNEATGSGTLPEPLSLKASGASHFQSKSLLDLYSDDTPPPPLNIQAPAGEDAEVRPTAPEPLVAPKIWSTSPAWDAYPPVGPETEAAPEKEGADASVSETAPKSAVQMAVEQSTEPPVETPVKSFVEPSVEPPAAREESTGTDAPEHQATAPVAGGTTPQASGSFGSPASGSISSFDSFASFEGLLAADNTPPPSDGAGTAKEAEPVTGQADRQEETVASPPDPITDPSSALFTTASIFGFGGEESPPLLQKPTPPQLKAVAKPEARLQDKPETEPETKPEVRPETRVQAGGEMPQAEAEPPQAGTPPSSGEVGPEVDTVELVAPMPSVFAKMGKVLAGEPSSALEDVERALADRAQEEAAEGRKTTRMVMLDAEDDSLPFDPYDDLEPERLPRSTASAGGSYIFNLHNLIREIHHAVQPLAKSREVMLSWFTAPTLPPLLVGDVPNLRQSLLLLLQNSVQATSSSMVQLFVRHTPSEIEGETDNIMFSVIDPGTGMRADSGFFHAWELAERTGGKFSLEYAPKGGTQVNFSIGFALPSDVMVQAYEDAMQTGEGMLPALTPDEYRSPDFPLTEKMLAELAARKREQEIQRAAKAASGPGRTTSLADGMDDTRLDKTTARLLASIPSELGVLDAPRQPYAGTAPYQGVEDAIKIMLGSPPDRSADRSADGPAETFQTEKFMAEPLPELRSEPLAWAEAKPSAEDGVRSGPHDAEQPESSAAAEPLPENGPPESPVAEQGVSRGLGDTMLPQEILSGNSGNCVVITDMTTSNRRLLQNYFSDLAAPCVEASALDKVGEFLRSARNSLVVYDGDTPEDAIVRSITTLRQSIQPGQTIAFLVIAGTEEQLERLQAQGATHTLLKPFEKDTLLEIARTAVPQLFEGMVQSLSGFASTLSVPSWVDSALPASTDGEPAPDAFEDACAAVTAEDQEKPEDILAPEETAEGDDTTEEQQQAVEPDTGDTGHYRQASDTLPEAKSAEPVETIQESVTAAPLLHSLSPDDVVPSEGSLIDFIVTDADTAEDTVPAQVTGVLETKGADPAETVEPGVQKTGPEDGAPDVPATSADTFSAEPFDPVDGESEEGEDMQRRFAPGSTFMGTGVDTLPDEAREVESAQGVSPFSGDELPHEESAGSEPPVEIVAADSEPVEEEEQSPAPLPSLYVEEPEAEMFRVSDAIPKEVAAASGPVPTAAPAASQPAPVRAEVSLDLPENLAASFASDTVPEAVSEAAPEDVQEQAAPESVSAPEVSPAAVAPAAPTHRQAAPILISKTPVAPVPTVLVPTTSVPTGPVDDNAGDSGANQPTAAYKSPFDLAEEDGEEALTPLPGLEGESIENMMLPLIPGLVHVLEDTLADAVKGRDAGQALFVQEAVNRLANKALVLGLTRLSRIARCVERAAEANDFEAVSTLLVDLIEVSRKYIASLEECYDSYMKSGRK